MRRRFFVDEFREGNASMAGDDATHLSRVLRAKPGQVYELSDNYSVYLAEIVAVAKDRVEFRLVEPVDTPPPGVRVALLAALFKFDRFEWMVEKATELGVACILPLVADRSERGLDQAARRRIERWRKIAREASQQSRRARVPDIELPSRIEDAPEDTPFRYCLEETAGAPPLLDTLPGHAIRSPDDTVLLAVGPEGGWTDRERSLWGQSGYQSVSLGGTILRAETAAVAALSSVRMLWESVR